MRSESRIKQRIHALFILLVFASSIAVAHPGRFFNITTSGDQNPIEFVLCANGKGALTCQNYSVTGQILNISSTIPNRNYPAAGIKVLTPNFETIGCILSSNGYCLFSVQGHIPTIIRVKSTFHSIGGTVTGYMSNGLVLQNKGVNDLVINANGRFTFSGLLKTGTKYNVTIASQPAEQTCSVTNGMGTVGKTDITNIRVTCSPITYTITPSSAGNGSISPSSTTIVNKGGSQTFTATPDPGYGVNQWELDGNVVQTGGSTYQLTNVTANHTVQVSFDTITLTPSISTLMLTINTITPAAARQITITNNGSLAAQNVQVATTGLPSGTTMSATTCSGTLTGGAFCTITITPGGNTTSNCNTPPGSSPTPGKIIVSADNASSSQIDTVVLGYGCIYEGGSIFSIDDTQGCSSTPCTGSIGGKVVTNSDVGSPGYAAWSAFLDNPSGTPGTDDKYDGTINTAAFLLKYPDNSNTYAANICSQYDDGTYSDWYLPAICELGYLGIPNASCTFTQNIDTNLVQSGFVQNLYTGGGPTFTGAYWSSTQYTPTDNRYAWFQYYALPVDGGPGQDRSSKSTQFGVRCVRIF